MFTPMLNKVQAIKL